MALQGNTYLPPKSRELNSVSASLQARYLFWITFNVGRQLKALA